MAKKEKWEEKYEAFKKYDKVEDLEEQDLGNRKQLAKIKDQNSPEYKEISKNRKEIDKQKKSFSQIKKNIPMVEKIKERRDVYQEMLDELMADMDENEKMIQKRIDLDKESKKLDAELNEINELINSCKEVMKSDKESEENKALAAKMLKYHQERKDKNQLRFSDVQKALEKELAKPLKQVPQNDIKELQDNIKKDNKACEMLMEGKTMGDVIAEQRKTSEKTSRTEKNAQPTKPEQVKAEQASAQPTEPVKAEQASAQPTEPVKAEPASAQPTEPGKAEQASAQPTEPVKAEPASAQPIEPVKAEPASAEPTKPEQVNAEPASAQPTEPVKTEPASAEPTKPEQVNAEPASAEPTNTEPEKAEQATQESKKTLIGIIVKGKQYDFVYSKDGEQLSERKEKLGFWKNLGVKYNLFRDGKVGSIWNLRKIDSTIVQNLTPEESRAYIGFIEQTSKNNAPFRVTYEDKKGRFAKAFAKSAEKLGLPEPLKSVALDDKEKRAKRQEKYEKLFGKEFSKNIDHEKASEGARAEGNQEPEKNSEGLDL